MPDVVLQAAGATAERILHERGLDHLRVRVYGKHLIIHSGAPQDGENRARLTLLGAGHYRLDMADHRGRWEQTPFVGPLLDLLTQLIDDFGFVLVPWEEPRPAQPRERTCETHH